MTTHEPELIDTPEAGPVALRGSALRAAGYTGGLLFGLASAPLLIRHLGVVDFGRYITVISVVGLVAGLTEGGLNAIALREYARHRGDRRWVAMRDLLGMRIVLTAAGAVAAVAFAALAGYDDTMVLGTIGAAAGLLLSSAQAFLLVGLQGELRFGWVTVAELVRQAVTTAMLVVLILVGAGLVALLWVALPAAAVALAFAVWLVRGRMPLRPSFSLERWRPLLHETLPYAVAVAIGVVYFRAAILIASLVTSDVETGYFATSFRVVEILLAIPVVAIGAAYPILVRSAEVDAERHRYALGRTLELSLIAGALVALLTALGAPVAIDVLAGDDFADSIPVLRIQAVALAANFVAVAAGYGLLAAGRTRAILLANAIGLTATVVLNIVLAGAMGAEGAAIATSAAEWMLALALVVLLARRHPGLLRELAVTIPVLALAAGAAAALVLVPGLPAVGEVLAAGAVFAAVLRLLGRFPPEVAEALRSRRLRSGSG